MDIRNLFEAKTGPGVRCQFSALPPTSRARSSRSSEIQVAELVGVTALAGSGLREEPG